MSRAPRSGGEFHSRTLDSAEHRVEYLGWERPPSIGFLTCLCPHKFRKRLKYYGTTRQHHPMCVLGRSCGMLLIKTSTFSSRKAIRPAMGSTWRVGNEYIQAKSGCSLPLTLTDQ